MANSLPSTPTSTPLPTTTLLSLGHVTDIVKHPRVPDRDLFVFDVKTDKLIETVDTLGTLLYGMTVDSKGTVFVAQTDARNDANGLAGTKKHGLKELGNRAFLNQVTRVRFEGGEARKPEFLNLEPLPPENPADGMALATPFAIEVSGDDSTLFVSAAGSDKVFSMDAKSGKVLGRVKVGAVPRGIALSPAPGGKPKRAWVLNAVENSLSVLGVSNPKEPPSGSDDSPWRIPPIPISRRVGLPSITPIFQAPSLFPAPVVTRTDIPINCFGS